LEEPLAPKAEVRTATKAESKEGITSQLPKVEQIVDLRTDLVSQRAIFKAELPHLTGGRADQTELQLKGNAAGCVVETTVLTTLHKLADILHLPVATNWVDRRNQMLLTSQLPGKITSELPLIHQYQDWMPKEQLQNFHQKTELFVVPLLGVFCCFFFCVCVCGFFSVLLTSPLLFCYPYSYPLHFPYFSCTTIHCFAS
jgi:hypothetical protein